MTAHPTADYKDAKDPGVSRRVFVMASAAAGLGLSPSAARAGIVGADLAGLPPYGNGTLPGGIRSRVVTGVNGLTVHMLEAGFEESGRPAVVLLHGFPELAYSWRKAMLPLAAAGYHVIAPDQRGYGRTTGWDDSYDADPDSFRTLNMVRDVVSLVYALGHKQVDAIVGHDAGAPVAAWSALIRPDIFRSLALMSSPFAGAPSLPFNTANGAAPPRPSLSDDELDADLAKLDRPRKYYQNYQRTRGANDNMLHAPQGLHAFLRAYYHYKSADWKGNKPFPLKARTAEEMAKIPTYYVMDKDKGMAETVAAEMPSAAEIAACKWLTDAELDVYVTEYGRTGFTGALQGYRVRRGSDWGVYQTPGAAETMQKSACTRMVGFHLLDGAGHWVQQEQPEQVRELLIAFLRDQRGASAKP
jgi:pimeloyl-ACP methyl ester carboxylesterase